jgi:hypothetical protein
VFPEGFGEGSGGCVCVYWGDGGVAGMGGIAAVGGGMERGMYILKGE